MSQQNIRYLCYRLILKNKNIKSMYNTPTHSLNNTLEVVKFKYFFYYLNDYDFLQNQTELFEIVNKISLQSIIPFTAQKTIKKQLNTFVQYSKHNLKKEIYSWFLVPLPSEPAINTFFQTQKKINLITEKTTTYWLNMYSFYPAQSLINEKFSIINFNILNSTTKHNHSLIIREALQTFSFLQLNRVAAHFTATIYSALILKDSKALTTFIRNLLRDVHFKEHPFYFTFVGYLIRSVIQPQLHHFACLGVSVVFRGKLGIGGNARKRTIKYQTGMVSSSSKYVKLTRSQDVVRTKTGIVGFTVIVAW